MILESKGALQTILKLILQLWLFGLFLHFFGQPAMKKYQEKKVLVVTSRRGTEGTQAPAVTIVVNNKNMKTGWKKEGWTGFVKTLCKDANTTEALVSCIENQTYDLMEITTRVTSGAAIKDYANEVIDPNWIEDFPHTYAGRTYTLDLPIKIKASSSSDSILRFGLNISFSYEIYIHDRTFFYVTRNPEPGHPCIRKYVDSHELPYVYAFALTEVEELNVPDDPCNEDADYNFRKCIKESFSRNVRCTTKWDDLQNNDLPLCASIQQFEYIFIFLYYQKLKKHSC